MFLEFGGKKDTTNGFFIPWPAVTENPHSRLLKDIGTNKNSLESEKRMQNAVLRFFIPLVL